MGTCIFKPSLGQPLKSAWMGGEGFSLGTADPEQEGWRHRWPQELLPAREMLSTGWRLCPSGPGDPRELEQRSWEQWANRRLGSRKVGGAGEEGGEWKEAEELKQVQGP